MQGLSDLPLYVAALVAVYLLPGPDMALVVSTSVSRGLRNGLLSALGLGVARAVHVVLSGLGLAALFAAQPLLFDVVRWLGALYLLWLAWKIVTAPRAEAEERAAGGDAGWTAVRHGLLTNLLNPKAFMFCALLLPQFVDPAKGAILAQYAVLGAILLLLGGLFDTLYAVAASRVAGRFKGSATGQRLHRAIFSSVFVLAAMRLAVGEQ